MTNAIQKSLNIIAGTDGLAEQAAADAAASATVIAAGGLPGLATTVSYGARKMVLGATRNGTIQSVGSVSSGGTWDRQTKVKHRACFGLGGVYLRYSLTSGSETEINNVVNITSLIEYGSLLIPVTFQGNKIGRLDPAGGELIGFAPIDVDGGDILYTHNRQYTDFGPPTTLSASVLAGATSFTIAALPRITSGWWTISGTNVDRVLVDTVTGSGPYTVTLVSGQTVAHAHSSGDAVGQQTTANLFVYSDYSEGVSNNGVDLTTTAGGSYGTPNSQGTVTVNTTTAIGVTEIILNGRLYCPQLVLSSGTGNAETVDVKTSIDKLDGTYRTMLAAPTTKAHTSGDTVAAVQTHGGGYGPTGIFTRRPYGTVTKSVIIMGDSISAGTAYTLRQNTTGVTLACDAALRPHINNAVGGETAQVVAAVSTSWHRNQTLQYGDWLYLALGFNDIIGNGRTLVQVQGDINTIMARARRQGLKVALATVTPRTTSTDSWATTANQTVYNSGREAVRLTYNAWVRNSAGADVVVEIADAVETARDSGIWKADASGPYTQEGFHPTVMGHVSLVQPAVATALALMT